MRPSALFVLDASSLLRFTDKEAGAERVSQLLKAAAHGDAELLISAVNWGEVCSVLYRQRGLDEARSLTNQLKTLPIKIMPVHVQDAEAAGIFKQDFRVPYADAYAGSLAMHISEEAKENQATLVTADNDFRNVPMELFKIEFLPNKPN